MDTKRTIPRAPTLNDVAQIAGVSVSTAARVLRQSSYPVDQALQEKVKAAALAIGYVPNLLARNLRGGSATTVGLIVGDIRDPYYGEIASSITERAESEHGMLAIVCNMQRDPVLELSYCKQLWEHRVGGLILAGGGFDQWSYLAELSELVPQIVKSGVMVATLSPRSLAVEKFTVDNRLVGELAANALIEKGHRRIGIILGPLKNEVTQQRLAGVSNRCTEMGVGFSVVHTDYSPESGARAMGQLMEELPGLTGVIAGSYLTAMTAIAKLAESGLNVPGNVSVVGIGSLRARPWYKPELTTIDLGLASCGAGALDLIAARIKGNADPEWRGQLPLFLEGTTLAPPPSR